MIPKISMQDENACEKLLEAFRTIGFVVLTDTSVTTDLINLTYEEWASFFNGVNKVDFKFGPGSNPDFHYFPFKSENAKDAKLKDLKEFTHIFDPFKMPKDLPTVLRVSTRHVMTTLDDLGREVLGMLDMVIPEGHYKFVGETLVETGLHSKNSLLRVLHYPPVLNAEPGEVRAAAHEDINLITLLPAASASGLEVQDRNGVWHAVDCAPGEVIVNVGDMLQEMTDGYLKSTTHRVVNPPDSANISRYSMPYFMHAHPEVVLNSKTGLTAQAYLEQRLKEIGLI